VPAASRKSLRGLDWFTFFVADIQTGFGPFLAVYLTTQKWNQADIGLVLAAGSIAGLLSQLPGGWLVDRIPAKRKLALWAVVGIGASALIIALLPSFLAIMAAKLLHVVSSAVLGPAIAAITLGLVGHAAMGPRLGRNARFAAIGNGLAAGVMGACGYFISPQAVFYVTAALAVPTALALAQIHAAEIDPVRADGGLEDGRRSAPVSPAALVSRPALIMLAVCVFLFHAANAAMLPLVGSEMTARSAQWATALVAICIVVPQLVAALIAPSLGRWAVLRGRRPVLLLGFAALPARAAALALSSDPGVIIAVQVLDGLCAAVLGVMVPLSLADISKGTGRFNLAQGLIAVVTGCGAALSTTLAGYLAHNFGASAAFAALAATAVLAFLTVLTAMPETSPSPALAHNEPTDCNSVR
jgi:MFS family permease